MINHKKIPYFNLIPILIITFFIFKIINHIDYFARGFGFIVSILSPFFWGFGIAYILNPLMVYIENKFKLKRVLSIIVVYVIVFGFLALIVNIISPTISKNIKDLVNNTPFYLNKTQDWFENNLSHSSFSNNPDIMNYAHRTFNSYLERFTMSLNATLNFAFSKAIAFTSSLLKMIFGFIIAIYILKDKENFIKSAKKFLFAMFNKNSVESFLVYGREVNSIFSRFIIGKAIDSTIIGILCAIGLSILNVPYALLISLIVGVTNMIPYFGPFIGMVPGVTITLFYSPIVALKVLLFIFLLQQFDGWYLGPKILGEQVGVSPFWIILAIILGGGTFGVLGMFLGVPFIAIVKVTLQRYIDKRLAEKSRENNAKPDIY